MGNVADTIDQNKNLISSVSQPLAVMGLNKIGQKVAGRLLTPAVWALNYGVNGATPDKVDVGLFGIGLFGGAAGPATIMTGIVKAMVDDDMDNRLSVARRDQTPQFRAYIKACYRYGSAPPQINAMKIANAGGTAWLHNNGLWVYITDARGRHVPNFKPKNAKKVYQPEWPLKTTSDGKFKFTVNKPA